MNTKQEFNAYQQDLRDLIYEALEEGRPIFWIAEQVDKRVREQVKKELEGASV